MFNEIEDPDVHFKVCLVAIAITGIAIGELIWFHQKLNGIEKLIAGLTKI